MIVLYVDLDGTLAEWRLDKTEKDTYQAGYFFELAPYERVLEAIKELHEMYFDLVRVKTLSAYHKDNPYAVPDKNRWLDKHLPEITRKNRIFVPCGENKAVYCGKLQKDKSFLLDDFSKNLHEWDQENGTPIKLYNGVNSPQDEKYAVINKDSPTEVIVLQLLSIMDVFSTANPFAV